MNSTEDIDMADRNGDQVVTMMDVLKEQQEFEEDANAVLGASDDKNCTYAKGYIKRQALYACLTCCKEAKEDSTKRAGLCLACCLTCHENHDLIELYTKRNFRCDCGNPKFNSHPCQFTQNKTETNDENNYNQNFSGIYCVCHRPFPDPEATYEDEMIQCIICEDWLHSQHLEATVPPHDQYSEMICKQCMEKNEFLHDYSNFAVNPEVDVVGINESNITLDWSMICNGEVDKSNLVNGDSKQVGDVNIANASEDNSKLDNVDSETAKKTNFEEQKENTDFNPPTGEIEKDTNASPEKKTDNSENNTISTDKIEDNKPVTNETTEKTSEIKQDFIQSEQTEDLNVPKSNENMAEVTTSDSVHKDAVLEKNVVHMEEETSNGTKTDKDEDKSDLVTDTVVEKSGEAESQDNNMKDETAESSDIKLENIVSLNDTSVVENTKDNKRKLCPEEETSDGTVKKLKLSETNKCSRPQNVNRTLKGATFWPSHFRQKLCTCNECIAMYKDLSVLFLIDPEDTVTAYELLGKEKTGGVTSTQYEKGLEALSSLDRIQQINALTEYNIMKEKLLDFLKSFKDRKEVVKEEDIKAFFAGMKPKREPDGVYFCR